MKKVSEKELQSYFPAPEGAIQLIYGKIRNGKSTHAVRRMFDDLFNGMVVYSNIKLNLDGIEFDERQRLIIATLGLVPLRKRFFVFSKENFHWFNPLTGICDGNYVFDPKSRDSEIEWLNSLTDCRIYYDEGHWLLDSYESTKASLDKRKLVTESGHLGRTLILISQRTQSIHVNARGNVNQFFRCSKHRKLGLIPYLLVEEFQDMKGTDVDEEADPVSTTQYFRNGRYWGLFDTHYLRAGRESSQPLMFEAFDLSYWERIKNVIHTLLPALMRGKRAKLLIKTLGVKEESASLKNRERLDTVPVAGSFDYKASIRQIVQKHTV